jgi:type IV secretion system protein VirB3
MSEKKLYSAYNGLGRVAMVWGIPLMALLCAAVPIAVLTIIAAALYGPGGLLGFSLLLPVLGLFKKMCETDEQALRIVALEMRCWISRRLGSIFGNTLTLAPIKLGRRLAVYRQPFRKEK